jgi:thiol:disulfide interchange protein DsbD
MPLEEELYLPSSPRPIGYIGKVWSNFQEVNFQQNSQPLNVLVSPEEEVLAKPRGYKPDAKSYLDFLECGLETFEQHKSKLLGSKQ